MNTPNPLVPQGTKPSGGKSTIRIAVFTILLIHVALIGGFLIQGCSPDKPKETPLTETTDTNLLAMTNDVPPMDTNTSAQANNTSVVPQPQSQPPVVQPAPAVVAPAAAGSDYVIVKGDTLAGVAKNHHVSLKALQEANPGVDSRKLKVGQKIQIPGGAAMTATAAAGATATTEAAPAAEGTVYTVKAGDVLARIAKNHGTTAKAIAALNNLKSLNAIKPGQKLKMPAAKASAAPAAPEVAAVPASAPAPAVTAPAVTPLSPMTAAPATTTVR